MGIQVGDVIGVAVGFGVLMALGAGWLALWPRVRGAGRGAGADDRDR